MQGNDRPCTPRRIRGFTLIEFAIVMVLSALMMSVALSLYSAYLNDARYHDSYEKQLNIRNSLASYRGTAQRYPCPARRDLPLTDPQAGIEDCTLQSNIYPVGTCLNSICKVPGQRDTPVDVETVLPDPVLIGAVPYRTIKDGLVSALCYNAFNVEVDCADPTAVARDESRLTDTNIRDMLDTWMFQMTYAITLSQTAASTFKPSYGAIAVRSEIGNSLVNPPDSAHYVIVSHGSNRMGGYSSGGILTNACVPGTVDFENCNDDSIFTAGLLSMAPGAGYYDDIITYQTYSLTTLWEYGDIDGMVMYNRNDGNVGIGTSDPEAKLHVNGEIAVDQNLVTNGICNGVGDPGSCWTPATIGGLPGLECDGGPPSAGEVNIMTGVAYGKSRCEAVPLVAPVPNQVCPVGTYMRGVNIAGSIICEAP